MKNVYLLDIFQYFFLQNDFPFNELNDILFLDRKSE